MAFGVNLTEKDINELYALKALPPGPPKLQGNCAGCGRGIPVGYLPIVTKWGSKGWGSFKVMVPEVMYCRNCGSDIEGVPKHRHRRTERAVNAPAAPEIPLKEIATKVFPVVSADEGRSSRTLARLAGLDSRDDDLVGRVKIVMRKLRDAGKVKLEDGKWWRV